LADWLAPSNELDAASPHSRSWPRSSSWSEVVLKRGSLSHPLVAQARSLLGKGQGDDRGILWTPEPCLDVRVSKESLDRALRIMAGLIRVIEDAGFSVSVETRDRKHQTFAKIHGEEIRYGSFGADFTKEVRHLDIEEVLSAPRSPWQRASIERVIGSIRRECIDHVIVFNEAGLYRYRNIRASNSNGSGSRNSIWENSA